MDTLEAIERLYYNARRATIERDLARAIDHGLSQIRSEWASKPDSRRKTT